MINANDELLKLVPTSIRKHAYTICLLAKTRSIKTLRTLLLQQSNTFYKALIKISKNILTGDLRLSPLEKKRVRRFAGFLRRLVYKTSAFIKRRLLLNTARGTQVISVVLKILAPVLSIALKGVL